MISPFTYLRLYRIARQLLNSVGCQAWKATVRLAEESKQVDECLRATKQGNRIWDAVAVMMAFGVHVADHYARNFLAEKHRTRLIRMMIEKALLESKLLMLKMASDRGERLSTQALTDGEKYLAKLMQGLIPKFERCELIHYGGVEYRGGSGGETSLTICGFTLMCAFLYESDIPKSKMRTWEEMNPKHLELYDLGRQIAWEIHENVKKELSTLFAAEGFPQIRDLGRELHP